MASTLLNEHGWNREAREKNDAADRRSVETDFSGQDMVRCPNCQLIIPMTGKVCKNYQAIFEDGAT